MRSTSRPTISARRSGLAAAMASGIDSSRARASSKATPRRVDAVPRTPYREPRAAGPASGAGPATLGSMETNTLYFGDNLKVLVAVTRHQGPLNATFPSVDVFAYFKREMTEDAPPAPTRRIGFTADPDWGFTPTSERSSGEA